MVNQSNTTIVQRAEIANKRNAVEKEFTEIRVIFSVVFSDLSAKLKMRFFALKT